MNSFNTAYKNIKKSSKDYSVYFFTLIIGIAIFYMFNSVGSQDFMGTITESRSEMLKTLVTIINVISVGVAIVFGLLIIYANNFLIKRRKKELGVYIMLGMSKKQVARIISLETLMVGIVSLAAGLLVGVFGSQLLSIIVGKLFEVDLSAYKFSFSMSIVIKTVIYFAIIFFVVLLFNNKSIKKKELIDLLYDEKKAEKQIIKNPKLSVVLFIISILILGYSYYQIGFNGRYIERNQFILVVVLGVISTFLFFFSLAGFLPEMFKRNKSLYYSKLNAFVSRQLSHNINSSAASFALISIMLFLAIALFSVGFSMNGYLNNRLANSTPVDVSAECLSKNVSDLFNDKYKLEDTMDTYVEMPIYNSHYIVTKSSVNAAFDIAQAVFPLANWDATENVVRLSDYNKLEDMYGRKHIELKENEYANICDFDTLTEICNEAIKNGNVLNVGDYVLTSGYKGCVEEYVLMSGMTAAMGVIVVPDAVIDSMPDDFNIVGSVLAGNYKVENGDQIFEEIFEPVTGENQTATTQYFTATQVNDRNIGISVTVVFVVLYIGIVFTITSAAVIALKILSDSIDSVDKYKVLMRIGADVNLRKKALCSHILLNFMLPFILSIFHSIFALRYAKVQLMSVGMHKMFNGCVIAVLVMIVIYGGYFIITYEASKRIVITDEE